MPSFQLFIDASADPKSKIAFGSYLIIEAESDYSKGPVVKTVKFEKSNSSKAELQILLYALNKLVDPHKSLVIYTDSNTIISLARRKESLLKNDFRSKNNRLLNNHLLYKEFYKITESLNIKLVKVKGHSKSLQQDSISAVFSIVDRASRKALRRFLKNEDF